MPQSCILNVANIPFNYMLFAKIIYSSKISAFTVSQKPVGKANFDQVGCKASSGRG